MMKKIKTTGGSAAAIVLLFAGLGLGIVNTTTLPILAEGEVITTEDRAEILWLARAIYSETKLEKEQELVAWVVRNRVDSDSYANSYKGVVLEKNQFSGLNPSDEQYGVNIVRGYDESGPGWDSALSIAEKVYFAPDSVRPFSKDVLHFYSPKSVSKAPSWSEGLSPVKVVRDIKSDSLRFAFYGGVK